MGWYHFQLMDGKTPEEVKADMMCADGTCAARTAPAAAASMTNGASTTPPVGQKQQQSACHDGSCYDTAAREEAAREEIFDGVSSGRPIYHLCQKELWLQAVRSQQPYFPPTFWSDGRFTRGSCVLDSLVGTANTYYKAVAGEWLVLELDPTLVYQMGTRIAVHRAPESTPLTDQDKQQPSIQCLKIHGGIPTAIPGLVTKIYRMQRDDQDGTFLSMVQTGDIVPRVASRTIQQMLQPPSAINDNNLVVLPKEGAKGKEKMASTSPAAVGMKEARTWFLRGKLRKGKAKEVQR